MASTAARIATAVMGSSENHAPTEKAKSDIEIARDNMKKKMGKKGKKKELTKKEVPKKEIEVTVILTCSIFC